MGTGAGGLFGELGALGEVFLSGETGLSFACGFDAEDSGGVYSIACGSGCRYIA